MIAFSQIITSIGLILEFLSVFLVVRYTFFPLSYEERKSKHIDKIAKPIEEKLESERKTGILTVSLLSLGMFLQGIAIFLS